MLRKRLVPPRTILPIGVSMDANLEYLKFVTRRQFFNRCGVGLGGLALGNLMQGSLLAADSTSGSESKASGGTGKSNNPLAPRAPHFAAKAKHVIYLHMAGSPSQLDLFDNKPKLIELNGQPCPES